MAKRFKTLPPPKGPVQAREVLSPRSALAVEAKAMSGAGPHTDRKKQARKKACRGPKSDDFGPFFVTFFIKGGRF